MTHEPVEDRQAQDTSEGVDAPGTRSDIGVGSADRPAEFGPQGAGIPTGHDEPGNTSEATEDTSVETPQRD